MQGRIMTTFEKAIFLQGPDWDYDLEHVKTFVEVVGEEEIIKQFEFYAKNYGLPERIQQRLENK